MTFLWFSGVILALNLVNALKLKPLPAALPWMIYKFMRNIICFQYILMHAISRLLNCYSEWKKIIIITRLFCVENYCLCVEYLRVILLKKIQFACFFQILSLFVLEIQQKVEVFDKYCTYLIACVCSFNYALAHAIIVLLFKRWYHFICRICIW